MNEMNKNITLIVLMILITACTSSQPQSTVNPSATNTTGPPTPTKAPTKTPTNTPVPPTPTPLPFDSFLDSYCGPDLVGIHHRFLISDYSLAANKEEGPSLYFICHQGESYYFQATGFKPDEWIILESGVRVKAPTGDLISVFYGSQFPDNGNMVVFITFTGFEVIGDWTLTVIGSEGSEASASFSYTPSEPSFFIYDQEVDENGDPTYFAVGTGWDPGETLFVRLKSPYGTTNKRSLGIVNDYGYTGLIPLSSIPPDPQDGDYITLVAGSDYETAITIRCLDSVCAPLQTPKELAEETYKLGREAYQDGDFEKALELFTQVIELNPKHDSALNYLAWTLLYHLDRDYEEALECAIKSVDIEPDSHNLDTLGLAYFKNGDYQNALLYYNLALFFNDNQSASYRGRGDVFSALSNKESALKDYETYLSLEPEAPDRSEIEEKIKQLQGG